MPVVINDWNSVDGKKKMELWAFIQNTHYYPSETKECQPEEVWVKFVEDTLSADFHEKSSRFSNMRTNQKLIHIMGRKGYPRVAYEMRKNNPDLRGLRTRVWTYGHLRKDGKPINEVVADTLRRIEDCYVSISDTPAEDFIRDDVVARILGPERHGRVRGLGFGVVLSKVDGQIQSSGRVKELESHYRLNHKGWGTRRKSGSTSEVISTSSKI